MVCETGICRKPPNRPSSPHGLDSAAPRRSWQKTRHAVTPFQRAVGAAACAMRVWLDPAKLDARDITADEILAAIREQNVQVAAGKVGELPAPAGTAFQYSSDPAYAADDTSPGQRCKQGRAGWAGHRNSLSPDRCSTARGDDPATTRPCMAPLPERGACHSVVISGPGCCRACRGANTVQRVSKGAITLQSYLRVALHWPWN